MRRKMHEWLAGFIRKVKNTRQEKNILFCEKKHLRFSGKSDIYDVSFSEIFHNSYNKVIITLYV